MRKPNRRKYIIPFILLLLCGAASAQDQPGAGPATPAERSFMQERAVDMFNKFMRRMIKVTDCPLFELSGTLEMFEPDAYIEASSLLDRRIRRYTPAEYFRTVNGLKCSVNPLYRYMKFDYEPVYAAMAVVSGVEGNYSVRIDCKQLFQGQAVNSGKDYCDLTIKEVLIKFTKNDKGETVRKIQYIIANPPVKCH